MPKLAGYRWMAELEMRSKIPFKPASDNRDAIVLTIRALHALSALDGSALSLTPRITHTGISLSRAAAHTPPDSISTPSNGGYARFNSSIYTVSLITSSNDVRFPP